MSKKRLLVAGGSHADIPLIQAAKSLGYYTISSGNRAEDLGHQYSDEVQLEDYSDPEKMLALAKKLKIDFICAGCNDFSLISSTYVAEKLGLPGYDSFDTAVTLHHKDQYREFALKAGIPTPYARGYSAGESVSGDFDQFRFPIIVKPVDLTGGKGIGVARTPEEAERVIDQAFSISRAGRIVVEEFIEGSRHGFSLLVRDRKVIFQFADDEHYFINPYLVSAASTPTSVSTSSLQKLVDMAEAICSSLDLADGIFHIQFIETASGPEIIEICRRPPGDLYITFVKLVTGVDYPEEIVKAYTGAGFGACQQRLCEDYFARHCIMSAEPGRVRAIDYDPLIREKVVDQMLWWSEESVITDPRIDKLGIAFIRFDSEEEMRALMPEMQELIKVRVC